MKKRVILFICLVIFLVGCSKNNGEGTQISETPPTPGLATPVIQTTQVPDVETAAVSFLNNWVSGDFQAMYALLSPASQQTIPEEDFVQLYHDVAVELALESVDYMILSSFIDPTQAQVAATVNFNSRILEGLSRDIIILLSLSEGNWVIDWSKGLIFPELEGDNMLQLTRLVPSRGNIYDREGSVIVAYAEAISLGISHSQIDPEREEKLLNYLGRILDVPPEVIYAMYEDYRLSFS